MSIAVTGTTERIDWEDRDLFEVEEAVENESDINVLPVDFERLLIAPSDWTVSTIYDLIGKQLHLDPAYQRRNVWQAKSKSQFIESLLLGIPIPQILLASKAGQKNVFLVLDGKQRLTAIKEFIDGFHADGSSFKLKGLRILTELNGNSWEDLQGEEDWADRLRNEPLRTTVMRGWDNEAVLYEIFYRLNSGSVKLSPMELRMSLLPGDFLKFIIAWTEEIGPLHHLLRKRQPDARMSDVELAIRFLAFNDQQGQYTGDLKAFLDDFCRSKNEQFSKDSEYIMQTESLLNRMNFAINVGFQEFGEKNFCRKYTGNSYESRFNRAVFDVMMWSLISDDFSIWVSRNPGSTNEMFKAVCSGSSEFVKSIESTTKSTESTRARFTIWQAAIHKATGISLRVPDIR